ncbi:hypothetical protein D5S17_29125 [Pseudonocardiaceae bacterium YIM PH 21723]|nr:hypothetical protein D5S17_29125 [Pseudonocardiaceae bacterium YIM PH 21723]
MDYRILASISCPAEDLPLDELRVRGAGALLDEEFAQLTELEGPDGEPLAAYGHFLALHPDGVIASWTVEAPSLAIAESSARVALQEILTGSRLLADWTIESCEVTVSDEELAAAAQAEDPVPEPTEQEVRALTREQLLRSARCLTAFSLDDFGPEVPQEHALMMAGSLIEATGFLMGQLHADIQLLETHEVSVDEYQALGDEHDGLWIMDVLPERFADRYFGGTVGRMLLTSVTVLGHRLTEPAWHGAQSTAEALALHLIIGEAKGLLEHFGVVPMEEFTPAMDRFATVALADVDHKELGQLYDPDGVDGPDLSLWFTPRDGRPPHPFLLDNEGLLGEEDQFPGQE